MKIKAVLAISLILAVSLSGCASGSGTETVTSAAESTIATTSAASSRLDELGKQDFGGKTFTVLDANGSPSIHINISSDELTGDIINDGIKKRDSKISELYNVKIAYQQIANAADGAAALKNSVLAGDKMYDMIISTISGGSLGTLATEGILANLCDIDKLSLECEWWSPLIYENCRLDGKMYYTASDLAPSIYCAPACYYANGKLLADYGISADTLYDKVESGAWTLDYLNSIAGELDTDLNQDNNFVVDDDFFGILNETNALTACVFTVGAGVKLSSVGKDGKLVCDTQNENTNAVIEKLKSMLSTSSYKENQSMHTAFINDRAMFFMHYVSSSYTRYRDMKSDFIILPIPKFDEKQESYYSLVNTWCNSFIGVPTTTDMDKTGFLMEALAYVSHEELRPLAYETAFKNKGARSDKDAQMLDIIFNTLYLDFNSFTNFGGFTDVLANAVFGGGNFTSGYAAISDSVNQAMQDFSKAWSGN